MQLCLQCPCGRRLHRSYGLQKTQALRMTPRRIHQKLKWSTAARSSNVPPQAKVGSSGE